ncbi:hypothetical protein DFJ74DRAFT_674019 [Hyaloraphidium curvatum]|nr:hypothetical protein DFJ74DRAFT_674019 [Hyaloraphidium curvatum]
MVNLPSPACDSASRRTQKRCLRDSHFPRASTKWSSVISILFGLASHRRRSASSPDSCGASGAFSPASPENAILPPVGDPASRSPSSGNRCVALHARPSRPTATSQRASSRSVPAENSSPGSVRRSGLSAGAWSCSFRRRKMPEKYGGSAADAMSCRCGWNGDLQVQNRLDPKQLSRSRAVSCSRASPSLYSRFQSRSAPPPLVDASPWGTGPCLRRKVDSPFASTGPPHTPAGYQRLEAA